MKSAKRGIRRFKTFCVMQKRKRHYSGVYNNINGKLCIGKLRNTSTPCSCHGCGNPRKFAKGKEKRTMQERRMNDCLKNIHKQFLDENATSSPASLNKAIISI